jgi:D-serine deaminase-like pyridoxal phosphate-dependent protein
LEGLLLEIVLESDPARFALLATGQRADLLVVDADMAEDLAALAAMARSAAPALRTAIITGYWSDREPALRQIADVMLFKPPRRRAWHQALAQLGVLPLAAA